MDEAPAEDWQETIFANRHVHNRKTRPGGSRKTAFHPRKCFGTYSVSCPAARKQAPIVSAPDAEDRATMHDGDRSARTAKKHRREDSTIKDQGVLDVWRLADSGPGLLGMMTLPGVLEVSVVLAGSRDAMKRIIAALGQDLQRDNLDEGSRPSLSRVENHETLPVEQQSQENGSLGDDPGSASSSEASEEEEEEDTPAAAAFQKNSFRSPKFWLKFQQVPASAVGRDKSELVGGWGYVVFSGNDCCKFKGTLTCETLGWDNVPVKGWKRVGRSERDDPFTWSQALL